MEKKRREILVSGKCDKCQSPAHLPWEGGRYCYHCWNKLVAEEVDNVKKRKKGNMP